MLHDDPPPENPQAAPEPDSGESPLPDLTRLRAGGQALTQVQQDETAALVLALTPQLSPERARRAEQAARMLWLWSAAGVLRENGMLNDLFGGT